MKILLKLIQCKFQTIFIHYTRKGMPIRILNLNLCLQNEHYGSMYCI